MKTDRELALESACQAVIDNWSEGDLAAAANECSAALEMPESKPTVRALLRAVRTVLTAYAYRGYGVGEEIQSLERAYKRFHERR